MLDSSLTSFGKKQVEENSILLERCIASASDVKFYSSPLGRAVESTKILCHTLKYPFSKVTFDERLQEVDLGDWSGKSYLELRECNQKLLADSDHFRWYFKSPSGESYSQVESRCNNWLQTIDPKACNIVMSHGLLGRVLRGNYANLDFEEAIEQNVPQRGFYKLDKQKVTFITDQFEEYF